VITEERIEQLAYEFVNDSDGTLGALQNALRNAAEESDRTARQECAETGSENDICNICNELLDHWKEQNKPHLDDEDKCCYVLAVRAADEIRRLRAEVEALRGVHEAATRVFKFYAVNKRNFFMAFRDLESNLDRVAEIDAARTGE
jgi:metal-responsive CopG/Arc/MetJ family transcriptional regulator